MASAKKVATKTKTRASKKDYAKVELPKGFTAIASGSFGEVWEYEQLTACGRAHDFLSILSATQASVDNLIQTHTALIDAIKLAAAGQ